MIYYRLLRDNKETGPYSEEEMIAKGFKPYDLLWAEGKSAGWQYPSEMSAFKKYAPIVEEQPYDRFYKKQPPQKLITEERASNFSSYTAQAAKTAEPVKPLQTIRPAYDYNVKDLAGRHIHVTLPSGNTLNLTTLVAKKEVAIPREAVETNKIPVQPESKPAPAEKIAAAQQVFTKETKTTAATTGQLNNYADNPAIVQPVYQVAAGFSWTLILGAVVGIATMVGLGIMIGLSMNRQKNDLALSEALNYKFKQRPVPVTVRPATPVSTAIPAVATDQTAQQHTASPVKNKELVQNTVIKTTLAADNSVKEEKRSMALNNPVPEKIKPVSNQEEVAQRAKPLPAVTAVNIEKSLRVSANDFKTGAFGGISGLKCTLFNGSKLPLESVEVEVDYIQANNKIYKTEKLLFKDISAGAQATVEAPASSRGVKVISRIIKINPKEAALSNTTAKS
jgi:hypothetical protein